MKLRGFVASAAAASMIVLAAPAPSHAAVGSTPSTSFPGFNGTVYTVASRGNTIYVGGRFSSVTDSAGAHSRHGAAAINATTGKVLPWNPNVKGTVYRIAPSKSGVFLGGKFKKVRGVKHKNVAKVTLGGAGKADKKFKIVANYPVRAIAVGKTKVYFGGDFTKFAGKSRTRLAAVASKAPYKLLKWGPEAQIGGVRDLSLKGASLYVAGEFRQFDDLASYQRIAKVNAKSGKLVKDFNPKIKDIVLDIAVSGSTVYAGLGGPRGGQLWAVSTSDGSQTFQRRLDGDVQSVLVNGGEIYAGGHFNQICPDDATNTVGDCTNPGEITRRQGASFSPDGNVTAWDPEGNGTIGIAALATVRGGGVAAGGDFTAMNQKATPVDRFALFN